MAANVRCCKVWNALRLCACRASSRDHEREAKKCARDTYRALLATMLFPKHVPDWFFQNCLSDMEKWKCSEWLNGRESCRADCSGLPRLTKSVPIAMRPTRLAASTIILRPQAGSQTDPLAIMPLAKSRSMHHAARNSGRFSLSRIGRGDCSLANSRDGLNVRH